MQQLNDENSANIFKEKDNNIEKIEIEQRQIISNNYPEFLICLKELKEKIIDIIKLSQQLKSQYDFIIKYYPNLFDIILSYQKSFFFLQFIAETEILNSLEVSRYYILKRINLLLEVIKNVENKQKFDNEKNKEIEKIKENIKNLYETSETINNTFREKMNKFLEILKTFPQVDNQNNKK